MTDSTLPQDAWLAEAERLIDLYGCACRAWSQGDRNEADKDVGKHHSALLAHLRTRPASPAVPPGWKMVPIEPTAAMLASVSSYSKDQLHAGLVYRAMLAASPAPAAQPAVPVLNEREAFWAWVEDRGCDTDGAWSAWQARAALSPLTAFCPACFAACDIKEMYAEAADAKRYRWLRANVMRMPDYAFSVDDEVEAAIDAALSVRPSNDIADDIPGSTAAGGRVLATDALPEGWRLVPIEPTTEMCLADWNVSMSDAHTETGVSACAWAAMLAAAPEYVPEDEDGVHPSSNDQQENPHG